MTIDFTPNRASSLAEVAACCRSDRHPSRWPLAAAAGDPVALSALAAQLVSLPPQLDPRAAIEILAMRRPDRLDELAAEWPDEPDDFALPAIWTAWAVALRHLHRAGHVDPHAAALTGPLRAEAMLCGVVDAAPLAPLEWHGYCHQARQRRLEFDELRTIANAGFVDECLDTEPLTGLDPAMLRPLRGRWSDAVGLDRTVDATDLDVLGPWGLAMWWEASSATGWNDRENQMSAVLLRRVQGDAEPARWWPAVLAFLTSWVAP